MHIKNKWCIIILIWSIICMTKAMLIYSCNIYTHIDIWVIYVYVCLWVAEIIWEVQWKHRTTLWQNEFWWFFFFFFFSEAHQLQKVCPYNRGVNKMMFRFYTFEILILLFAFRLKRQRELLTTTVQLPLLVPHFFLLCVFFGPFCVFESLTLKMTGSRGTAYSSFVLSLLVPPSLFLLSQSSPGW